jgi:Domain of unknown function (DUF4287)
MSFQAYIDNIKAKTGKTPEELKTLAEKAGIVDWLKKEFDLGHGHSMAIWAVFKDSGWVNTPKK